MPDMDKRYFVDIVTNLEARMTALEIVLTTLLESAPAGEFKAIYADNKVRALDVLLNNANVSDKLHTEIESVLARYEDHFCLMDTALPSAPIHFLQDRKK